MVDFDLHFLNGGFCSNVSEVFRRESIVSTKLNYQNSEDNEVEPSIKANVRVDQVFLEQQGSNFLNDLVI